MKAIILAAGFATRLYPLTENQAKPLLDIAGRPMLTRLLDRLLTLGAINEVIVIANEKFNADFEEWKRGYASRVPIRILNDGSTDDTNKLGAIGDMAFALDSVPEDDEWLVVAGDNLFEFDPARYYEEFNRHGQPLLLLREIEQQPGKSRYNEVTLNGEGIVTRFREKPDDPQTNLASICFYYFPPDVKLRVTQYLAEGNNPDAPGYFIQWLVGQMPVRGIRFEGPWFDIGSFETLEQARAKYR